jgi:hypothetical protein
LTGWMAVHHPPCQAPRRLPQAAHAMPAARSRAAQPTAHGCCGAMQQRWAAGRITARGARSRRRAVARAELRGPRPPGKPGAPSCSCAHSALRWSTGLAPCSRPGGRGGLPSSTVTAVPARTAPPTIGGCASRARSVRWLPSSRLASAASSGHRAPPTSATCGRFPTGPRKQQPQLRSSGCRPRDAFASCGQSAVVGRAAGVPCGPCGCSGVPVRCASGFAGSYGCARWLAWSLVPTSPVCVPCATATPAAVAALAAAPAAWLHGFRCRRHALRHRHIRCLRSFARVVARAPVARVRASRVRASRCPPPAVFARAWARSHYRLAPAATASPQSPPSPPPRLSRPRRHRLAAIATVSPPSPPPRLGTMPLPPPCRPSRRRVRVRVVTACRPFRCAGRSAAPPGRARRLLIARSRARWPVRGVLRRAATAVMRLVAA